MSLRLSTLLAAFFVASVTLSAAELTVAAAADLSPVEAELASSFRNSNPGIQIRWVTSASAILTQQIENGAPYDVFLSANAQFIDQLAAARKIEPSSVVWYATGRVGLLWRDGKHHDPKDLGSNWVRTIALPNPKLAPYGVAAEQAIRHLGIWDFVRQKIVYGENVRQTLQLFESGNADAVLTSASLLAGRPAEVLPADWHSPIAQKAGVVVGSANHDAAEQFVRYLLSPAAQAVFARHGFAAGAKP
ncbi:MAG: molybdate ABC transporter substrate-binding protein [Acidobacteriaceae bacterium]|nr:molybdate ABC transporter substrate-binding protein [Acidobacteriaceae bacterium]